MKNITLETLLRIIPKNRITFTIGFNSKFDCLFDMDTGISALNKISEQKFEIRFIQSKYHSGLEVSDVSFQEKIYQLSQISSDILDIEEMLLQINEWCPQGYFFDFIKIDTLKAVVFIDEYLKDIIVANGYEDHFYFLHQKQVNKIKSL